MKAWMVPMKRTSKSFQMVMPAIGSTDSAEVTRDCPAQASKSDPSR